MFSQTKLALEEFDNEHEFERLCADILNEQGHRDVVLMAPRGGADNGKDITFTNPANQRCLACVTTRKDIERKFQEDFGRRQPGDYEVYYLFCTTYLTTTQKNSFSDYCRQKLDADFVPQDIEATRSLLDNRLTNIRYKYLGITEFHAEALAKLIKDGFAETEQRIKDLREQLAAFSQLPDTRTSEGQQWGGIVIQQERAQQATLPLKYLVLGVSDKTLANLFRLCADEPRCKELKLDPAIEVRFDDIEEMRDVFSSLRLIAQSAQALEATGVPHQEAFERAWDYEVRARAAKYVTNLVFPSRHPAASAVEYRGFEYVILGLTDHVATIRGLRTREMLKSEQETELPERNAIEICITDFNLLLSLERIISNAAENSRGDSEDFVRMLMEGIVRQRLLGLTKYDNRTG